MLGVYIATLRNQSSNPISDDFVKRIRWVTDYARSIRADTSRALINFSQRTTPIKLLEGLLDQTKYHDAELEPGKWPRAFCYGALLLQSNNKLDGSTLAVDPTLYILGFTCKFCNLEVGDYRMSESGKTLISTRLLAASHITSCRSFTDRRAAYKCLPCHARHFDIDFPSPAALEQHLKKHPNSKPVRDKEEKDVVKELGINPKELDLEPEEEEVKGDDASLKREESVESSLYERSTSFAASTNTAATTDAASTTSTNERESKSTPNSTWNDGSVPSGYFQNQSSDLGTSATLHPTPYSTGSQQTSLRPGSGYRSQTPQQNTKYPNPNEQQPGMNTPPLQPPYNPNINTGYLSQNNAGYPTQAQAQAHPGYPPSGPPPHMRASPVPHPPNRLSSDSARYQHQQGSGRGPDPVLNDLSDGYHPQERRQPQQSHYNKQSTEHGGEKRGLFGRKKDKDKK
jgi:hypothetical protein